MLPVEIVSAIARRKEKTDARDQLLVQWAEDLQSLPGLDRPQHRQEGDRLLGIELADLIRWA